MDDPFNFDMRVSTAKKKNAQGRRRMSGAFETSQRVCEHPGCKRAGKYRAPKGREGEQTYLWFCKEHVREYNLRWNFFETTPDAETPAATSADKTSQTGRADRPAGTAEARAWARLGINDARQILGGNATRNPGHRLAGVRRLPQGERRALEILEARDHWTKSRIRQAYKALIKVLHPDMNGGDRGREEQLAKVVWAWDQIKDSRNFN